MKKSFAYPILFMSLVTAVFVFGLAFLENVTAEQIDFLANTELQEKILYVFDIPVESEDPEEIDKQFNEHIDTEEVDGEKIYSLEEDGNIQAYAFPVGGAGLWGSIEAYVGITSDYSEIVGLEFIDHEETPGLGGRISEDWFKEQFRGINLEDSDNGDYVIYTPASGGNVDAITGATLTSQSVRTFLNDDIEKFLEGKVN